jgi:hypothetical protein
LEDKDTFIVTDKTEKYPWATCVSTVCVNTHTDYHYLSSDDKHPNSEGTWTVCGWEYYREWHDKRDNKYLAAFLIAFNKKYPHDIQNWKLEFKYTIK